MKAKRVGDGETVQLASRIPKRLHLAATVLAIEEERPLQDLIAEALREHLARCQARTRPRAAARMALKAADDAR